jgi:hypothetical protein
VLRNLFELCINLLREHISSQLFILTFLLEGQILKFVKYFILWRAYMIGGVGLFEIEGFKVLGFLEP